MLTLAQQPRFYCPNSKSRPLRWVINTDEHITAIGQYPVFSLQFDTTGAANGETVEIAGVTFTVDNATPYTETTWSTVGSTQAVATNFMNMLRCNYRFADFQFFLSFSGLSATANAFGNIQQTETPWSFDVSGLTITVSLSETNGSEPDLKDVRLWYQIYEDDVQIGERKQAFIPYDQNFPWYGTVRIDAKELARAVVRTTRPDINTLGPISDPAYYRRFHLRFGTVELDDLCNETFGKVYKSLEIFVTNSVFQLHHTREFRDHCPNGIAEVKFLSDRPTDKTVCRTTTEWIHIWLEHTAFWLDGGDWNIVYNFYDSDDVEIGDLTQTIEEPQGAVRLPIGPWNPTISSAIPNGTTYYTVRVFGWRETLAGTQLRQYSETLTRHLSNCNCKAAEVYFLEDFGSWRTVVFERLERREIDALDIEVEGPLNWNFSTRSFIYPEGERSTYVEDADQYFAFSTGRLNDEKRREMEQLLRSPEIYIRTVSDVGEVLRRVIPDRGRTTTFTRGEVTKLIVVFRFNARLRNH